MPYHQTLLRCRFSFVIICALALAAVQLAAEATEQTQRRLDSLRREIAAHDERYHRQAAPIISDFEYDQLKRELRELERALTGDADGEPGDEAVPDDRSANGQRWRHRAPMLSLLKAYSAAEIDGFHARIARRLGREEVSYVIEPKIDGVAVSVTYVDGRFVAAATRGNGAEGDNITAHVAALRVLPATLVSPGSAVAGGALGPGLVELRGELFVPWEAFHRLNAERERAGEPVFGHPRTVAAATIKQQAPEEAARRGLALVFYGLGAVEPEDIRPTTQWALHEWLRALGLPVLPDVRVARVAAELHDGIAQLEQARATYPFPVDGLVVKLDAVSAQQLLGSSRQAPRWAIAWKFEPERVKTRLRAITWQVGRTGILSPVGEFDPVELGGSTIRRASLHNPDEIVRRDLRIGDVIVVEKAGEIIPAVVGVERESRSSASQPYVFPEACPSCDSALPDRTGGTDLRCIADFCPERLRRQLEHYVGSAGVGIEGLGPATLAQLIERGRLRSVADLYRLQREDLPPAQVDRLLAAIDHSRTVELERLLRALGLPGVGAVAASALAEHFRDLSTLLEASPAEWETVPGLGSAVANAVQSHLADPKVRMLLEDLIGLGVGAFDPTKKQAQATLAAPR